MQRSELRIVVLDDDRLVARATARILKSMGFTNVGRCAGPLPDPDQYEGVDLVITDWDMPEGGGARVVGEALSPVIVVTGNADPQGIHHQMGVPVVSKPFTPQELEQAILSVLSP